MRERLLALHAALLGAWLGASVLVAAKVAPAAFASFATRTEAGSFVGKILHPLYLAALAAGVLAAALAWVRAGRWRALRCALGGLVAASGAVSLAVASRIAHLRETLGPIDALPPEDPGRRLFGALHGASVLILLAGMIAATAALALEAFSSERR